MPIIEDATWTMDDSYNYPVPFQFGTEPPFCTQAVQILEDDELQLDEVRDKINILFGVDRGCPDGEANTSFFMMAWRQDQIDALRLLISLNAAEYQWEPTISEDELLITTVVDFTACGGSIAVMEAGRMWIGTSWHNPQRTFTYDGNPPQQRPSQQKIEHENGQGVVVAPAVGYQCRQEIQTDAKKKPQKTFHQPIGVV